MQQSKISAFFKPSPSAPRYPPPAQIDRDDPERKGSGEAVVEISAGPASSSSKIAKKKRTYAQYHLELGQSDFLLRSCAVCGMMYACGDEADEKLHRVFHKNCYEGIQFKGWRDERVVMTIDCGRILLVEDGNPPAHKRKVKEALKIMEKELGYSDEHILHKLCKVYLFISSHRIIGCLVTEPIRAAHRIVTSSSSVRNTKLNCANSSSHKSAQKLERQRPNLQFGGFTFKRDVIGRNDSVNKGSVDQCESGAVLCEEESVPAICGFRAIWVVPSQRRKRIASHLLDAARKSFYHDKLLEHSLCAFSPPTSSGKALASNYCSINSFLIYREDDACSNYKNHYTDKVKVQG